MGVSEILFPRLLFFFFFFFLLFHFSDALDDFEVLDGPADLANPAVLGQREGRPRGIAAEVAQVAGRLVRPVADAHSMRVVRQLGPVVPQSAGAWDRWRKTFVDSFKCNQKTALFPEL